ncbi:MAG: CpsD/CapB family tyrosine-protein kinase [Atopobiaceae bacterium]|nr:CpsD/CapB family tyrosine-protein kinase [Atopobiaceae bacterium]
MARRKKKDSSKKNDITRNVDNSAKTLLANIRFMRVDDPVRTVVITSTVPNEGKTFVSTNLARAMATSGVSTLIVECDMRRRSVANTLGIHSKHGIYSVLSGEVGLREAIVPTDTPMLYFLDAEPHIPNPSDLLNSRRFLELIHAAKQEFGYIVFDTPPVGTFVDAAVLGSKVDALFMVVREQFARKDAIARAADQLRTANVPLSGVIMNFCERHADEYYNYYYYRDDRNRTSHGEDNRSSEMASLNVPAGSLPFDGQVGSALAPNSQPRTWSNAPDLGMDNADPLSLPSDFGASRVSMEGASPEDTNIMIRAYQESMR